MKNVGALDRATYLGSSDCAAILGLSPWTTPLDIYLEKIGEAEPITEENRRFFDRRKRMEPFVLNELMNECDISIVYVNNRYQHPDHPFIATELDFEFRVTPEVIANIPGIPERLIGTIQNGEIKTSNHFAKDKFGEEGSDEIPIAYCAQAYHAMAVTGRDLCLFTIMTGFDQFSTFILHRDDEVIDGIIAKELVFWNDHVVPRVPPMPLNNEDIAKLFSKVNGAPVDIDTATMEAIKRLEYLRATNREIEGEMDELKFRIGSYVAHAWGTNINKATDDAILNYNGSPVAKWKKQRRESFDTKRFKDDNPELYNQYLRETFFRVLK